MTTSASPEVSKFFASSRSRVSMSLPGEVVVVGVRPQLPHLVRDLVDDLDPLDALGRGDPGELETLQVQAEEGEELAENGPAPPGVVVSRVVVAVAGGTAADQHAVGPVPEGFYHEQRVYARRARQ